MRIRNLLFLSVIVATPALGQQPAPTTPPRPGKASEKAKPAPDSLEAVIADAMRSNPDVRAAEAKVREAEINLNKVRTEVMVGVVAAREVAMQAREMHRAQEQVYAAKLEIQKKGQASNFEMLEANIVLQRSKATLIDAEAQLHKLVGRVPGMPAPGGVGVTDSLWADRLATTEWSNRHGSTSANWPTDARVLFDTGKGTFAPIAMAEPTYMTRGAVATAPVSSNMIEKIRAALDKPVVVDKGFQSVPIQDVLTYLRESAAKDVPFRALIANSERTTVSLMPGELPLGAWLIAIQDEVPDLVFLVREYGVLVTTSNRAPKDAMSVADFWRSRKAEKPAEAKPKDTKK